MDFSAWSPSHTILVAITLVIFGVQLIVILMSLKIRTERLEQRQDKTDNQIETVRLEITKQISETRIELRDEISGVRDELRGEIADVRTEMNQRLSDMTAEISKLNQNHIDHLSHHKA